MAEMNEWRGPATEEAEKLNAAQADVAPPSPFSELTREKMNAQAT